jgi:flagellar motor component MotA
MRFAASQNNIDRVAVRLAWAIGVIGAVVAVVTVMALAAR